MNNSKLPQINELKLFHGKPIFLENYNLMIHQKTIEEIENLKFGYLDYKFYLSLATFDIDYILAITNKNPNIDVFENEPVYNYICSNKAIIQLICEAFYYFLNIDEIYFCENKFYIKDKCIIDVNNYKDFTKQLGRINGIKVYDINELTFKGKRAKEVYKKVNLARKKANINKNIKYGFKDILSVLCNAEGNGITLFNYSQLTIYQVYESYIRLRGKEDFQAVQYNLQAVPSEKQKCLKHWIETVEI